MSSQIIFVSSEASPLVKTGGLADVCGSLPRELQALGTEARVVLPWYEQIDGEILGSELIPLSGREIKVIYGETEIGEVPVLLVGHPPMFHREGLYDKYGEPYPDNDRRFILFSKAAIRGAEQYFEPDLYHCHDWFSGIVPMLLREDNPYPKRPSVFTIHNLRHQGAFPAESFRYTGIPWERFRFDTAEHDRQLNLMKAGITSADAITTVSPTYADEIQTEEFGEGLAGVLRQRPEALTGILNGMDTDTWDPGSDEFLAADEQFSVDKPEPKATVKQRLIREADLPDTDEPLISFVGRLVPQKGIDLLWKTWDRLREIKGRWIVLGTGQNEYEQQLRKISENDPEKLSVLITFSERWAHRIEAGSDLFCMPSRYEPCGLNQMYSMRYGTVPIVHRTGGLADTVIDPRQSNGKATGFSFDEFTEDSFVDTVKRAVDCYEDSPEDWRRLRENGMKRDFSWKASAKQYHELYKECLS